jgi:hypothetical protein
MSSPETAATINPTPGSTQILPYTGREFLDSLDDGREIWIYGERVNKITEHPAFRNCARMIARLYDALHEDHQSGKDVLTCPPSGAASPTDIGSVRAAASNCGTGDGSRSLSFPPV